MAKQHELCSCLKNTVSILKIASIIYISRLCCKIKCRNEWHASTQKTKKFVVFLNHWANALNVWRKAKCFFFRQNFPRFSFFLQANCAICWKIVSTVSLQQGRIVDSCIKEFSFLNIYYFQFALQSVCQVQNKKVSYRCIRMGLLLLCKIVLIQVKKLCQLCRSNAKCLRQLRHRCWLNL